MDYDIIIVGAGASGLMAAKELSAKGIKVLILEADNRIGGRIYTIHDNNFPFPIESGAEFIHGDLPITLGLLKEAGIAFQSMDDKTYKIEDGKWRKDDSFIDGWDEVMQKMKNLKEDITLAGFLDTYFKDEHYEELKTSVKRFAEGFDLVDINTASTISLRNEWEHENESQYRIAGGYALLIQYLEQKCNTQGCTIKTSSPVKQIDWKKNSVKLVTASGDVFTANKVIVTVPVGVLQATADKEVFIQFSPGIDRYINASRQIGFGSVIKVFMLCENFFSELLNEPAFILSNQLIPTWWLRVSDNKAFLTGWLGGPNADKLSGKSEEEIKEYALQSLSAIFKIDQTSLKDKMQAFRSINWSDQPLVAGGYSYDMIESVTARKILKTPVQQTVFFAGEALYEGAAPGTVEAALSNGKEVARKLLSDLQLS